MLGNNILLNRDSVPTVLNGTLGLYDRTPLRWSARALIYYLLIQHGGRDRLVAAIADESKVHSTRILHDMENLLRHPPALDNEVPLRKASLDFFCWDFLRKTDIPKNDKRRSIHQFKTSHFMNYPLWLPLHRKAAALQLRAKCPQGRLFNG